MMNTKTIIILCATLAFFSCKKEFPKVPDYSLKAGDVSIQKQWKYPIPDGETVVWIDATETETVYFTQASNKIDVYSYLFDATGKLQKKHFYNGVYRLLLNTPKFKRTGDWVFYNAYLHTVFFNVKTGVYRQYIEDRQYAKDSITDYCLVNYDLTNRRLKNGICYYQKLDKWGNKLIYKLDLNTEVATFLDTLAKNTSGHYLNYTCLGIFENKPNGISAAPTLLYQKQVYERFNKVTQTRLVGLSVQIPRKVRWESDNLSTIDDYPESTEIFIIKDKYLYVFNNLTLQCIDVVSRKLIWQREFESTRTSILSIDKSALYFSDYDGRTFSIDVNNGNTIWNMGQGYTPYQIGVSGKVLATVTRRKINEKEIFGETANHINLISLRNGRLLLKNPDPLVDGINSLVNSVAVNGSTIFLADHKYFMSFNIIYK